jgi:damage-control phosphatase, subfamily II, stand-alone protein
VFAPFCKLADPDQYVACPWNLTADEASRVYWVDRFKTHLETILDLGVAAGIARGIDANAMRARAALCRNEFDDKFDAFKDEPARHGYVTILTLDRWRDRVLRHHGFVDAFLDHKCKANAEAVPHLAGICRELDELPEPERMREVVRGVFAGNIADMGAEAVIQKQLAGGHDFHQTRRSIRARPWLIDDFAAWEKRIKEGPPHRKAVFFIDNAGNDFVLGVVPMMRWLAKRGTWVVAAVNERPTLNDMTINDVYAWWPILTAAAPSLGDLPIDFVSTGTGEPLIDLALVSSELNAAAADADLVILEGMGRAVESNLEASFSCDALNVAMIKDEKVAVRHGGGMFDLVFRFR